MEKKKPLQILAIIVLLTIGSIFFATIISKENNSLNEIPKEEITNSKTDSSFKPQEAKRAYSYATIKVSTLEAISKMTLNEDTPNQITKIFLKDMGFPEDIIKITYFTHDNKSNSYEGDYILGLFNLATGELQLNNVLITKVPLGTLTSVIRHELDHFERAAQICKSIGVEQYIKMMQNNASGYIPDKDFWQEASKYAREPDFDVKKYLNALVRSSLEIDYTSIYYILVNQTDAVRNPLEISAYSVSDIIEDFFKIPKTRTTVFNIAKVFNKVDWKIYNISQKIKVLSNSRVAIFDYYFLRALLQEYPDLQTAYKKTLQTGNNAIFWFQYKKYLTEFQKTLLDGQVNNAASSQLTKILNSMLFLMNKEISIKEIREILYLKQIILRGALEQGHQEALFPLKDNTDAFLKYLELYDGQNDKDKLKLLLYKAQLGAVKYMDENGKETFLITKREQEHAIKEIFNNKEFLGLMKKYDMRKMQLFELLLKQNRLIKI